MPTICTTPDCTDPATTVLVTLDRGEPVDPVCPGCHTAYWEAIHYERYEYICPWG